MKPVELYPHQQKAVDELQNGNILWGDVGTGKSLTAMAYYFTKVIKGVPGDFGSIREPKDIYIITTAKKRDNLDWYKEAIQFGIGIDQEYNPEQIRLTVDSWNNIPKYEEVKDAFFIFDEQRLVGSGAWSQTFIKIAKHNEWILLTATPGDTWLDYIPVFVANGFFKNRTQFKREHVVYNTFAKFPKVDHYVGLGKLTRMRNQILVHMPYQRHTIRHHETVVVGYDRELFDKVVNDRWHVYENRPLRDVAELFIVMRKVVNSDISRMEAIASLMTKHPKLIVFYNFDYELEILRTLGSQSSTITTQSSSNSDYELGNSITSPAESTSTKPSTNPNKIKSTKKSDDSWNTQVAAKTPTTQTDPSEEFRPNKLSTTSGLTSDRSIEESSKTSSTSGSKTGSGSESRTTCDTESGIPEEDPWTYLLSPEGKKQNRGHTTVSDKVSPLATKSNTVEVAEWNGHRHQEIPETERWVYLVQYQAGAEGWNCVSTDAMVFYSQTYSYKLFHQSFGRIDRLNTPYTHLWYYSLISRSLIDVAISKSLRTKKSFNEAKLAL